MHASATIPDRARQPVGAPSGSPSDGAPTGSRAAWLAWGLAAACYLVALFHRMALGVASLDVQSRFAVGPGAVAAVSVAGLTAYLLWQLPAGVISDRIGPRRGLALGLLLIAVGEALFAAAAALAPALLGRVLVGSGDAFIFLNVLRVAAHWFPRERFGQLTSLTAAMGAVGQLVTTVPLNRALDGLGWATTFWSAAIATILLAALVFVALRERPPGQRPHPADQRPPLLVGLRRSWARSATREGFWVHLTLMAPFIVITGLWGAPVLKDAQGMSRGGASAVLLVGVAVSAVAAGLAGPWVRRHPHLRHRTIQQVAFVVVAALAVLTFVPGGSMPAAVSVLCLMVLGVGFAGGMLSFDLARQEADGADGASTSALVNLGGFSAAIFGDIAVAIARSELGVGSALVLLPVLVVAALGLWRMSRHPAWRRPAPAGRAADEAPVAA
ncbi:MAG: MFS transporter [Solirubrobacteraceae bacterium]